jgi:copper(I)-binding protein
MNAPTTTRAAALALAAGLALAGCSTSSASGSGPELTVKDAYVPQPVMRDMAGGFLTVRNTGEAADELTSVTSDISGDVQLHETVDGRMRHVKSLQIPANGELKLEHGGNHLMFMGLKHKPVKGEKVSLELHFAHSDPIKVSVPVEAPNYMPKM